MKIEIGDKVKFSGDDENYTVVYFNEKFVIFINSSGVCNKITDLKHDGSFIKEECLSVIEELGLEYRIKFDKLHYSVIEKVTKKPKYDITDYPSEAYEYKGYYGHEIPLKSNAYYAHLTQ